MILLGRMEACIPFGVVLILIRVVLCEICFSSKRGARTQVAIRVIRQSCGGTERTKIRPAINDQNTTTSLYLD